MVMSAAPSGTSGRQTSTTVRPTSGPKLTLMPKRSSPDRKSTRLNSSHGYISYAVFCLKKKKKKAVDSEHVLPLSNRVLRTPSIVDLSQRIWSATPASRAGAHHRPTETSLAAHYYFRG